MLHGIGSGEYKFGSPVTGHGTHAGASMVIFERDCRVFLHLGYTDMRKAINGLSAMAISSQPGGDSISLHGKLFVFCGKRKNRIKILYWDQNGFCLWQKRLGTDRFFWPQHASEVREVSSEQLSWLLRGVDFTRAHASKTFQRLG